MDQYEWDSLHKRQQLLRRDAGVIDNISPALHTHAHLYSWLEKGPWCPLTSTVPIIASPREHDISLRKHSNSALMHARNGQLSIHKVRRDSL